MGKLRKMITGKISVWKDVCVHRILYLKYAASSFKLCAYSTIDTIVCNDRLRRQLITADEISRLEADLLENETYRQLLEVEEQAIQARRQAMKEIREVEKELLQYFAYLRFKDLKTKAARAKARADFEMKILEADLRKNDIYRQLRKLKQKQLKSHAAYGG